MIATAQRARWSYRRRMELALRLLEDPAYDALLGEPVRFERLPETLPQMLARDHAASTGRAGAITELIEYP